MLHLSPSPHFKWYSEMIVELHNFHSTRMIDKYDFDWRKYKNKKLKDRKKKEMERDDVKRTSTIVKNEIKDEVIKEELREVKREELGGQRPMPTIISTFSKEKSYKLMKQLTERILTEELMVEANKD